ncbi:hypothetical protein D3C78_1487780 [compost metagenome]
MHRIRPIGRWPGNPGDRHLEIDLDIGVFRSEWPTFTHDVITDVGRLVAGGVFAVFLEHEEFRFHQYLDLGRWVGANGLVGQGCISPLQPNVVVALGIVIHGNPHAHPRQSMLNHQRARICLGDFRIF